VLHTAEQLIKKARCLAKMILKLKTDGEHDCHEIDQLAQEASYIEYETRGINEKEIKRTSKTSFNKDNM